MRDRWRTMACPVLVFGLLSATVSAGAQEIQGPKSGIPVANAGGEVITLEEVEKALSTQLAQLERERHGLLNQKLEQLIGERLLAQEAKKRGLTVEQLLKEEVYARVLEVTDAEVTIFMTQNRARLPRGEEAEVRAKVFEQLRSQRVNLRRQAYVRALRTQTAVTIYSDDAATAQSLDPERYAQVVAKVLPKDGYTLPIKWGDLGQRLIQLGVIDLGKFKALYGKDRGVAPADLQHLVRPSEALITITSENAPFLVNVFWALGLANKNPVLDKAFSERGERRMMGLASTGGWTLGAKPVAELYSKFDLIQLTPEQQELVSELAKSIYRPCCDNPTALPDCNHGMALLGLVELMAADGFSRERILKASLKFNSFWFPRQYAETALLFQLRGIDWDAVDPKEVLGSRYSSLSGWTQNVDLELMKLAHLLPSEMKGASCAVSG